MTTTDARKRNAEADAERWRAEFNQADQRIVELTAELATARAAWDEWKASSRAGHAHASDMAGRLARAWDEGFTRGFSMGASDQYADEPDVVNPYEGEDNAGA